jgi:membrane protein DedA with SNARE-associated domain
MLFKLLFMVPPEQLDWLKHCIVIFFMTFIHEDAAILAAAFSTVEKNLPAILAYISVYLGIVAGDVTIYGLGHYAKKNKWLSSRIIGPKVERVKQWLEEHLVRVMILSRIAPGLLFPTFVACGWFRIPFIRFFIVSVLAGAVYSSLMLTLVIIFGDLILTNLGYWGWGIAAFVIIVLAIRNAFKPLWSKKTEEAMGDISPDFMEACRKYIPSLKSKFHGMPSLGDLKKMVATAERIPNNILYIPVVFNYLWLALRYRSLTLPTASNPMIETGGFMGESKSSVMGMVGKDKSSWVAEFVKLQRNGLPPEADFELALNIMKEKDLDFPVVAKPDIGWNGYGVRLVDDRENLLKYIGSFPSGENIILQKPVNYDGEAGIFYIRMPGEQNGKIYSVTLRYFPYVIGDGSSTLRELIQNDQRTKVRAHYYLGEKSEHLGFGNKDLERVPAEGELIRLTFIGSLRTGGLYRNASHLITPELNECIDSISKSIPEFYFGRYDVKFESTDMLKAGKGFRIIEINGAGSEAIQAWDPNTSLLQLYKEFFKAYKLLFRIGAMNRKRGYKPMKFMNFIKAIRKQNSLIELYPAAS